MTVLLTCSKKFRSWFNNKIKDTDTINKIDEKIDNISKDINNIDKNNKETAADVTEIKNIINKNNNSTILTLKYEILDICHRADRFKCITIADKALLSEMYDDYVNKWH